MPALNAPTAIPMREGGLGSLGEFIPAWEVDVHRHWTTYGGSVIDALLEHTPLIDAKFLVEQHKAGGVVPRGRDVPKAARIDSCNASRLRWGSPSYSVLVLSYPWLDKEHPDREGEQLAKIVPILEVMLKKAKRASLILTSRATRTTRPA